MLRQPGETDEQLRARRIEGIARKVVQVNPSTPFSGQQQALRRARSLIQAAEDEKIKQQREEALQAARRGRDRRVAKALSPGEQQRLSSFPGTVTKHQFSVLPEWDRVVLDVPGEAWLELKDFQVVPDVDGARGAGAHETQAAMFLTRADPDLDPHGDEEVTLTLPQRLLGCRVMKDVDGHRVLFLNVSPAVFRDEPVPKAPPAEPGIKARDQVVFGMLGEQAPPWTDQGVCFGYFPDVEGEVFEWRYCLGAGLKPILLVLLERDERDYPESVLERARELGAEQFVACLLGEVPRIGGGTPGPGGSAGVATLADRGVTSQNGFIDSRTGLISAPFEDE